MGMFADVCKGAVTGFGMSLVGSYAAFSISDATFGKPVGSSLKRVIPGALWASKSEKRRCGTSEAHKDLCDD